MPNITDFKPLFSALGRFHKTKTSMDQNFGTESVIIYLFAISGILSSVLQMSLLQWYSLGEKFFKVSTAVPQVATRLNGKQGWAVQSYSGI